MPDDDWWERRNAENVKAYKIHFISFQRIGTTAYSTLSLGQGQKPEPWHIEKMREIIRGYEAGEYDETVEDEDYSDIC